MAEHGVNVPQKASLRLVSDNPNPKAPPMFGGGDGFVDFKSLTTIIIGGVILFFLIRFLRRL